MKRNKMPQAMPDREKVIAGLNDIHAVACGLGDDQCYLNSIGIKQLQTLINDATALLKAQEPEYPVSKQGKHGWHSYCPKCETILNDMARPKYCSECGQAVKWE